MLRMTAIASFALLATISSTASAQLTYSASRAVGTGSVNLSITTDGGIGQLATVNILDWAITVVEGGDTFTLLSGNSGVTIFGTGVSATASDLLFDFGVTSFFGMQTPDIGSGQPFWAVQGAGVSAFDPLGPAEGILPRFGDFASSARQPYTGVQVIASVNVNVVPEPATWAMMLPALGLVGVAVRRRRVEHQG